MKIASAYGKVKYLRKLTCYNWIQCDEKFLVYLTPRKIFIQREAWMLSCKIFLFHKQPIIHRNFNFLIIFDGNGKEIRIYLRMKFWWLVLKTGFSGEIIGIEMFEDDLNLKQISCAHPISNQCSKTKYSSFSNSAHNFLSLLAAQRTESLQTLSNE